MTADEQSKAAASIQEEAKRRARASYLRATEGTKLMGLEVHLENEFLAMSIYAIGHATGRTSEATKIIREAGQQ